jgi:hypothetical protein
MLLWSGISSVETHSVRERRNTAHEIIRPDRLVEARLKAGRGDALAFLAIRGHGDRGKPAESVEAANVLNERASIFFAKSHVTNEDVRVQRFKRRTGLAA